MAAAFSLQTRVVHAGSLLVAPSRVATSHSVACFAKTSLIRNPSSRQVSSHNAPRTVRAHASADLPSTSSTDSQTQTAAPCQHVLDATSAALEALKAAVKPALAALLISAVLAGASPDMALAASGGGRMGGSSFSASRMRSYAPPSRSYSAPPVIVAPAVPFYGGGFGFSPFFFGPSLSFGLPGFGLFNLLFFGMAAWFILNTVMGFLGGSQEERMWEETQRSSVVRLQVGLLGSARKLQFDLERLADRADASTPEGLHYILQETVLALLRNPDYCVYGFSSSAVSADSFASESSFNRLSMEERSKFREETLVNVDGRRRRVDREAARDGRFNSEYIVVTVLAATEGTLKLPEIKSSSDLRDALTLLGSIPTDELQAVEVLWTPQNAEDTLVERDMLMDHPNLRSL